MLSTNTTVVFSSQKLFNSNKHLVFLLLHSPINSLARYLSIQLFMRAIPIARFVSKSLCFVTDAVFLSWSINPDTSAPIASWFISSLPSLSDPNAPPPSIKTLKPEPKHYNWYGWDISAVDRSQMLLLYIEIYMRWTLEYQTLLTACQVKLIKPRLTQTQIIDLDHD